MLRLSRRVIFAVLFVLVAGCSGGGCASGCSCAGVTPLPEGFPTDRRVENAASVRLTDSGIAFLESNLGTLAGAILGGMGGGLTFDIPSSKGDYLIISYEMCKNGPKPMGNPPECLAEIDLQSAQMQLDPENPHNLRIHGKLPLRVQKLPLTVKWFGLFSETVDVTINGEGKCPGANKPFKPVGIDVTISVEIDPDQSHSRYGYSRVRVGEVKVNNDDILAGLAYCNGGFSGAVLDAVDGLLIDTLVGGLTGTLGSSIEDALCQKANPELTPPCPTGTVDVEGVCRYGSDPKDECASVILGMDGNIDIGGLFASISPGAKGAFDFLFAAGGHSERDDMSKNHWGDINPIGGGVSLGMYGGAEPRPTSECVPHADVELPANVPIPDEILANQVDGWPKDMEGPHFGMALSERFTNYMLAQIYNSGALCLGITAEALGGGVPLNTSTIAVLGAKSLTELGRQKQSADVAILVRPGAPPTLTVGNGSDIETDPLLLIALPKLSLDFYVWSLDRYVRAMTATMDITVPMNLEVTPEGLQPVIKELGIANATVTNSALVREDPAKIAEALEGLLGSTVGGLLGGAISPIDLNAQLASLGMTLNIPPTVEGQGSPGLRKLTKGSDDFLGIFATLGVAQMNALQAPKSETSAKLTRFDVDPAGLRIETLTQDNGPRAELYLGSDLDNGMQPVEWQYKLDNELWHPFSRERHLVVKDAALRIEGKHKLYVRSRVAGKVHSLDPDPVELTLLVDSHPPALRLKQSRSMVVVEADDVVSGKLGTSVRVRFEYAGGEHSEWSAWMPADEVAPLELQDAVAVEVEAKDEAENVGTATHALIRGRDANAGAGCGCEVVGERRAPAVPLWLSALGLLGVVLSRRTVRRRGVRRRGVGRGSSLGRGWAGRATLAAALVLLAGLSPGCNCGDTVAPPAPAAGCRGRGDCEVLFPGLVGAYTSAAVDASGTIWVAGYLEANWADDYSFGDLVVGKLVGAEVEWQVVDGYDETEEVDSEVFDAKGFRGGRVEPGLDVGLWTSIAVDDAGMPGVAYYDASNKALKYAHLEAGGWAAATVQAVPGGDVGRYAKLRYVGGLPNIGYSFIERGEGGAAKSGVRLATGNGAGVAAGWSFEDVYADPATPCTADVCPSGEACVVETGKCAAKKKDCATDCAGDECVASDGGSVCAPVRGSSASYPEGAGLYVALAQKPDGGLAFAFYDRTKGNLMVAARGDKGWQAIVADGAKGDTDTGDVGIGASLAVDAQGNYHLAYVDGLKESLAYVQVDGGATPGAPEVVDSGLGNTDGQHLVGDDSFLFFTQGGEVHISYQDASSGKLRFAVGVPNAGKHDWTVKTVEQEGFAGFFSQQLLHEGQKKVLNWWRVASPQAKGNVRLVVP